MLALLIISFICLIIHRLTCEIKFENLNNYSSLSKNVQLIFISFEVKKFSTITIFILFVHLFFWFTQLFLTNNIKTNKVVIDTSKLIKTEEEIFKSDKVACFIDGEQEMNIAKSPNANNLLSKIYNKKTYLRSDMVKERKMLNKDRCLIKKDTSMFDLFQSDIFNIGSQVFFDFLLLYQSQLDLIKKIWLSDQKIMEYDLVMYFNNEGAFNRWYFSRT